MFAVPEILFSFAVSFAGFFGKEIVPLYLFFINHQIFIDYPFFLLLFEAVEWVGVLGLFLLSIKLGKKIPAVFFAIILLWLSVNLYMGYVISTMSLTF